MVLFQSLSQYGGFQNPGLHTCFGLNLNSGLNKTNVFASKPSFTQRAVLHKNCIHTNHVLAGPVQGLFAALSMVAGGKRRRRLNITNHPTHLEIYHPLVGGWEIRFLVGQVLGKHRNSWAVSHQVWSSVSSEQLGHLSHVLSRAVAFVMTFRDRHSVLGPTLILDSHLGWFLSPPCLVNYRQICPGSWFQLPYFYGWKSNMKPQPDHHWSCTHCIHHFRWWNHHIHGGINMWIAMAISQAIKNDPIPVAREVPLAPAPLQLPSPQAKMTRKWSFEWESHGISYRKAMA